MSVGEETKNGLNRAEPSLLPLSTSSRTSLPAIPAAGFFSAWLAPPRISKMDKVVQPSVNTPLFQEV
jgi:hypothetical protein